MTWEIESQVSEDLGFIRVYVTPPYGRKTDVTFFRNIPTQVGSFSSADPYGDSTASISFPQISLLDDLGNGDLTWLREFSDVDLVLEDMEGNRQTLWEGFIASFDWEVGDTQAVLNVTCQGALFQVDRYVASPQYPSSPIPYERLIADAFDPRQHTHLRTRPLAIEWPNDWQVLAYKTTAAVGTQAGGKSTGFATRTTGGWEKKLTGLVSNLLGVMYTTDYGDQWTIRKDPGRRPVMYIRSATRPPDFSVWVGQHGVSVSLTRDYTQFANVIYGSGKGLDGTAWTRQTVSRDNKTAEYLPMAADPRVNQPNNPSYTVETMRSETFVQFEDGMEETEALKTAQLMLRKNEDPGYTGSITLTIDPEELSRYQIVAGMTVNIRQMAGAGSDGMNLHISEVQVDVASGSVSLTVDSKYRDALTVDEVRNRTRDPLTPIKMLQVGKQSVLIPDQLAPWSYTLGSGYIPKGSMAFFDRLRDPTDLTWPFTTTAKAYPPRSNPSFYVGINASARARKDRWAFTTVRLAEKGDIRLSEFAVFDRNGNLLRIPFHVGIYYNPVTADSMPFDGNGPSPFITGAFQSNNQFGLQIGADTPGNTRQGDESMVVGWGDWQQPAGYSPGTKTNGDPATGLLIDETGWSFDQTRNQNFDQNPSRGQKEPESAITAYVAFYAEYHDWVYAFGRIYRKEPGS